MEITVNTLKQRLNSHLTCGRKCQSLLAPLSFHLLRAVIPQSRLLLSPDWILPHCSRSNCAMALRSLSYVTYPLQRTANADLRLAPPEALRHNRPLTTSLKSVLEPGNSDFHVNHQKLPSGLSLHMQPSHFARGSCVPRVRSFASTATESSREEAPAGTPASLTKSGASGDSAPLMLFNTFSRRKEIFRPLVEGHVSMYVCGVTAYDYSHIGHARVYVAFDVLYRWEQQFFFFCSFIILLFYSFILLPSYYYIILLLRHYIILLFYSLIILFFRSFIFYYFRNN